MSYITKLMNFAMVAISRVISFARNITGVVWGRLSSLFVVGYRGFHSALKRLMSRLLDWLIRTVDTTKRSLRQWNENYFSAVQKKSIKRVGFIFITLSAIMVIILSLSVFIQRVPEDQTDTGEEFTSDSDDTTGSSENTSDVEFPAEIFAPASQLDSVSSQLKERLVPEVDVTALKRQLEDLRRKNEGLLERERIRTNALEELRKNYEILKIELDKMQTEVDKRQRQNEQNRRLLEQYEKEQNKRLLEQKENEQNERLLEQKEKEISQPKKKLWPR